jgi:UDP-2,4-diacetamido-2,4,6-trideoxy-beta-L-altropyranose hydrolase
MHKHLFIRADANSRIGTGHIMRCIALGQAWKDAVERAERGNLNSEFSSLSSSGLIPQVSSFSSVVFICAEIPDALADRIHSEGFDLIRINVEPGSSDDLKQTQAFISGLIPHPSSFPPWFILDGYHFNLDYQHGVRAAGRKLLLIDDCNHLPKYECDILLNQNINAMDLDYHTNSDAKKLLGTQYALLRREFKRGTGFQPVQRDSNGEVGRKFPDIAKKILVTLGGADPDNVTLKVIQALNQVDIPDMQVKVVVGSANPHIASLETVLQHSTSNIQLINSADMAELIAWADLAVSAAGSTCWELCCLGVPFITLVLAENQRGLASGLHAQKIAFCAGERPSVDQITGAVNALAEDRENRIQRSEAGRIQVDGFGVVRALCHPAADTGLDVLAGRLFLRPAAETDMELFLTWANDPTVRVNCYNPDPIALDNHKKWFSAKLASEDTLMLVLEVCGMPAGQIRYDRTGDVADIGFSIDRRFRGLGLGQRIIEASITRAFEKLNVSMLRAEVFQSNSASQSAFVKTGFELAETCEIKGVASQVFIKKRS